MPIPVSLKDNSVKVYPEPYDCDSFGPASFRIPETDDEFDALTPYMHFNYDKEVRTKIQGQKLKQLYIDTIQVLSQHFDVYIRVEPRLEEFNQFEGGTRRAVQARFTVGPKGSFK